MPIPFVIAGLAGFGMIVGAGAHISAKETNEKAQDLSNEAQRIYNKEKAVLDNVHNEAKLALHKLDDRKKIGMHILKEFIPVFDRIKNIQLDDVPDSNELSKYTIEEQDVLELQELSKIYQPTLTNTIGTGVGIGVLAAGAGLTPVLAIASPVVLFTGISADMKAEENFEKAKTMYAQAESAVEKMKISETMCEAIKKHSCMYDNLLEELTQMLSQMTALLNGVTKKKLGFFGNKKIKELTPEEKDLAYITRSLAGAVKAIIVNSLLAKDGSSISDDSFGQINDIKEKLLGFEQDVEKVESYNYGVKAIPIKAIPIEAAPIKDKSSDSVLSTINIGGAGYYIRNMFALFASVAAAIFVNRKFNDSLALDLIVFSVVALLTIGTRVESKFFKGIRKVADLALVIGIAMLLYFNFLSLIGIKYFIIKDIALGLILFIICSIIYDFESNIIKLIATLFSSLAYLTVALFIFYILNNLIGLSFKFGIILTEILFVPLALHSIWSKIEK